MKLVCISDTHGKHGRMPELPDGDVLIVAGDISNVGTREQIIQFNDWIQHRPHKHKLVIAGNHDWYFYRKPEKARALMTNCTYLQDESVVIDGVKFYGSPWQPTFYNWAFNLDRGEPLREVWNKIPDDTDILITHGPPAGKLDAAMDGRGTGCVDLNDRVFKVRPKVHIFGHIHECYGTLDIGSSTLYVNASVCTRQYIPSNSAIVVDI